MTTKTKSHAEIELDILSKTSTDPDNRPIIEEFREEILAICEAFGKSGQSGGSAPYTASALSSAIKALCLQQPIAPITGEDWEWFNPDADMFQNSRCSAVFKDGINGKPYYLNAIVWKGVEEYDTFTGRVYIDDVDFQLISSRQFIKLPFKPKTFYIDVIRVPITKKEAESRNLYYIEDGFNECYYTILKDPRQLEEVYKYYVK